MYIKKNLSWFSLSLVYLQFCKRYPGAITFEKRETAVYDKEALELNETNTIGVNFFDESQLRLRWGGSKG